MASGATWRYAGTIHTLRNATGPKFCIGVQNAGPLTRWKIDYASRCNADGFNQTLSFPSMVDAASYASPLALCCLLAAVTAEGDPVQRLAVGAHCQYGSFPPQEPGLSAWKFLRVVVLLSRRRAPTDVQICVARAREQASAWRIFQGDACVSTEALVAAGAVVQEKEESLRMPMFAPGGSEHAERAEPLLCLCRLGGRPETEGLPKKGFSLREAGCDRSGRQEFCFQGLSVEDALGEAQMLDEVV